MEKIFFESWDSLLRTVLTTVISYIILIVFLRASGKRTLSKMNAFDLIVTIALGSTLATVILSKDVALADGDTAFFLLISLQYVITKLSVHVPWFSNMVKSTPTLLVFKGRLLQNQMIRERIHEKEIYAVLRENGISTLEEADAVILETDGSLTALRQVPTLESAAMNYIIKPEDLPPEKNS